MKYKSRANFSPANSYVYLCSLLTMASQKRAHDQAAEAIKLTIQRCCEIPSTCSTCHSCWCPWLGEDVLNHPSSDHFRRHWTWPHSEATDGDIQGPYLLNAHATVPQGSLNILQSHRGNGSKPSNSMYKPSK